MPAHQLEDPMEYPERLVPEASRVVRALESRDIYAAEMEGVRARLRNLTEGANQYTQINTELAAAWQYGFEQADQDVILDQVVLLLNDLFSHTTYTAEGQPLPDLHLWRLLQVAHMEALKYRE